MEQEGGGQGDPGFVFHCDSGGASGIDSRFPCDSLNYIPQLLHCAQVQSWATGRSDEA